MASKALSRLVVHVGGDASGYRKTLAQTAAMTDVWAQKLAPRIDSAFAAAVGSGGSLAKTFGRAVKGAEIFGRATRDVAAFQDVQRAALGARNAVDRLRLALTFNAAAADQLRERIGRTSERVADLKAKADVRHWRAFAVGLGVVAAKAALVGERALPGVVNALARGGEGLLLFGSSLVRAKDALVDMVPNALRAAKAMGQALAGGGSSAGEGRAFMLAKSLHFAGRAAIPLHALAGAFSVAARGAVSLAKGVAGVSRSLAVAAFRIVKFTATAALGLARGFLTLLGTATRLAATLGTIAAVGGAVVVGLGVKAASAAAKFGEVVNATKTLFGDYAGDVLKQSKAMEAAFGRSQRVFLQGATAFQGMLSNAGYSARDAGRLSTEFVKLAADVESLREIPFEEVLDKIRAGLAGETEPLASLGIDLRDNALKAYALAKGLAKANEELTESVKTQARVGLIARGLSKDMGALARDASGPAAQINEFWGRVEALSLSIGSTLAPTLGTLLSEANTGLVALKTAWEQNAGAVAEWFGVSRDSLGKTGEGVGILATGVIKIGEAWVTVSAMAQQAMSAWTRHQASVAEFAGSVFSKIADATGSEFFKIAAEEEAFTAGRLGKWADDLTKSAEERLAKIGDIGKAVRDAMKEAEEATKKAREEAGKRTGFGATDKIKPPFAAPDKGSSKSWLTEAFEYGSRGATEIVNRHRSGGTGQERHAKATAEHTKRIHDEIRGMRGDWAKMAPVPVVGLA